MQENRDQYAVWGNPIEHSLSPRIQMDFAKATGQPIVYTKKLGSLERFEQELSLFFQDGAMGCNITAPFKQRAFALADLHSERCLHAKSCNTLKKLPDGRLYADNTDGIGLVNDLTRLNWLVPHQNILILGAGGATQGVLYPLLQAQQHIFIANRNEEKAQALVNEFQDLGAISTISFADIATQRFDLCINATSLGLNGEDFTLLGNWVRHIPHFYDMQYKLHEDTPFIKKLKSYQISDYADGLGMLLAQGAESFALWRNVKVDYAAILKELRK
ncbi:shikimate dehydrogenase [Actinobacillus delphinicola]|uniref:shikimate dehydrogenase (NADP(+)) n=1 Tax=Actinobacillus delphinicola TaxID=51161 RepID=A0A448TTD7_9PAST|nr:shikimate dehydrogenase [Actinobacillus delphinicola]VEJ09262.1 shikimate 5-dehydrogenase [Actinobacillus delphinicola]